MFSCTDADDAPTTKAFYKNCGIFDLAAIASDIPSNGSSWKNTLSVICSQGADQERKTDTLIFPFTVNFHRCDGSVQFKWQSWIWTSGVRGVYPFQVIGYSSITGSPLVRILPIYRVTCANMCTSITISMYHFMQLTNRMPSLHCIVDSIPIVRYYLLKIFPHADRLCIEWMIDYFATWNVQGYSPDHKNPLGRCTRILSLQFAACHFPFTMAKSTFCLSSVSMSLNNTLII